MYQPLTLKAPITTIVVCFVFCRSFRSSLIWVHTVCLYANCKFEKFARRCSRRHKQTTFSDAGFLGALRIKYILFKWGRIYSVPTSLHWLMLHNGRHWPYAVNGAQISLHIQTIWLDALLPPYRINGHTQYTEKQDRQAPDSDTQAHYENMPIQIYWKFHHQKQSFQIHYFSYFCLKHRLWVFVRTASSTHNLCFWAEIRKIMYTTENPSFTI